VRLRLALEAAAIGLGELGVASVFLSRTRWVALGKVGRDAGCLGLLAVSAALVALRQVEIPGIEPAGYWPRWAMAAGPIAFDAALLRALPPGDCMQSLGLRGLVGGVAWLGLIAGGLDVIWFHRPLERLRAVVPGKIFISAMPTRRGLEIAERRHRFRTIIN